MLSFFHLVYQPIGDSLLGGRRPLKHITSAAMRVRNEGLIL
jgi:hypothetical protein